MQKRLISMVLALSMALTAMPLPALAQSAPPDTASTAALAEENDDVTDIFPDDWSGKPAGDPFGGGKGSWSYDETSNTLTLKDGTFRLRNYGYDSYNNCIQWNVKIEPSATLQEARIGSEYHNGYTVTNAGTISGGTFYGKVICEAGAVISGGTFKGNAIVNAAGGEVTIEDGTFEEGSYTSGVTVKAAGTLTINGGTFKGKRTCSVDINNCEKSSSTAAALKARSRILKGQRKSSSMAVCSTTSCMLQKINVPSTAVCSPLKMTRCPRAQPSRAAISRQNTQGL